MLTVKQPDRQPKQWGKMHLGHLQNKHATFMLILFYCHLFSNSIDMANARGISQNLDFFFNKLTMNRTSVILSYFSWLYTFQKSEFLNRLLFTKFYMLSFFFFRSLYAWVRFGGIFKISSLLGFWPFPADRTCSDFLLKYCEKTLRFVKKEQITRFVIIKLASERSLKQAIKHLQCKIIHNKMANSWQKKASSIFNAGFNTSLENIINHESSIWTAMWS